MNRRLLALALAVAVPALAAKPPAHSQLRLPEHVIFHQGQTNIPSGQEKALEEVKAYLAAKPEITMLRVAGHHDGAGHHAMAVARWLVSHGVDCKRLLPVGFADGKRLPHGGAYVAFVNAELKGKAIGGLARDAGGKHAGDPCAPEHHAVLKREHAAPQAKAPAAPAKEKDAPAQQQSAAPAKESAQAAAPASGAQGKRQAIIATAREYVGKVADQGGEGGKRKGWEVLKDIYDTSYNMDIFQDPKAKAEIPKSGGKYNSWCGIFALAMAKKSGAVAKDVKWVSGASIKGLPKTFGNKGIQPGDIIIMDMNGLWHHAIVSAIEGDTFHTIDGNSFDSKTGHSQTICEHTRNRKEISAWYKTVPDE